MNFFTIIGFGLGGEEVLQALILVISFGKGLVLQGAGQGEKHMIVGGCKVWAVQYVDEHFRAAQLKQLLEGMFAS